MATLSEAWDAAKLVFALLRRLKRAAALYREVRDFADEVLKDSGNDIETDKSAKDAAIGHVTIDRDAWMDRHGADTG